jgi:uncharacterized membrane protein YoaK (UPF0700 family)
VIVYLRRLTGRERTDQADQHLARYLVFIAGAANAGGFLAVQQYTSHMSGIVSAMADHLALGDIAVVLAGLGALFSFVSGAAVSAILINWGRRHELESLYAFPLLLEAVLLICFGLLGHHLARYQGLFVPLTVMLLCFIMGLQNAIITKLSATRIRTTHVTGLVTDMGIELGKLFYWNGKSSKLPVRADHGKLALLVSLIFLFFAGGVLGALGFKQMGFSATLFLAALLVMLAFLPVLDDIGRKAKPNAGSGFR